MFTLQALGVPEFRAPAHLRNGHVQTIGGAVLRQAPARFAYTSRIRLATPDGDWFEVDCALHALGAKEDAVRPAAVVLHGLESCARGLQSMHLANMFYRCLGADVYAMNFRGCSGALNATHKSYHLGETADLQLLIERLVANDDRRRPRPLLLAGFSLGGNVIVKYLGESAAHARRHGVAAAAVYCVPFDAVTSQPVLDSGLLNRYVYSRRFVRSIQRKIAARHAVLAATEPPPYDLSRVLAARTIGEIDDAYIAPTYGFADRWDYYRRCSCGQFLAAVRSPLLVVNAWDDPFYDTSAYPTAEQLHNEQVQLVYTQHGGHCGFLERWMPGARPPWVCDLFASWFQTALQRWRRDGVEEPSEPAAIFAE
ncbi:hypothetical protein CDCA_CDCA11G3283 [Cyanidium caldarium]|uniref:AB hydrolase-1 domain-containing protein n=1 Tax=Cyanidium caldarium TaxID=2771 RepID=A0AAV9IZP1_CYACA|nr:hypothetical protein CDCA_CDCA11G3283 [Cyanidium caldarium]